MSASKQHTLFGNARPYERRYTILTQCLHIWPCISHLSRNHQLFSLKSTGLHLCPSLALQAQSQRQIFEQRNTDLVFSALSYLQSKQTSTKNYLTWHYKSSRSNLKTADTYTHYIYIYIYIYI